MIFRRLNRLFQWFDTFFIADEFVENNSVDRYAKYEYSLLYPNCTDEFMNMLPDDCLTPLESEKIGCDEWIRVNEKELKRREKINQEYLLDFHSNLLLKLEKNIELLKNTLIMDIAAFSYNIKLNKEELLLDLENISVEGKKQEILTKKILVAEINKHSRTNARRLLLKGKGYTHYTGIEIYLKYLEIEYPEIHKFISKFITINLKAALKESDERWEILRKKLGIIDVKPAPLDLHSGLFLLDNGTASRYIRQVFSRKAKFDVIAKNRISHEINVKHIIDEKKIDNDGKKKPDELYFVKDDEFSLLIQSNGLDSYYLTAGKFYNFFMKEALETQSIIKNKKTGQWELKNPNMKIPLEKFVNWGMYSTKDNAREALVNTINTLTSLKFIGKITAKGKRKKKADFAGVLFPFIKVDDSICTVNINPSIAWDWFFEYCAPMPPYFFKLSICANNLLGYLLSLARINTNDIKEKGYVTLQMETAIKYLGLPEVTKVKNKKRDIIKPITDAIEEINAMELTYLKTLEKNSQNESNTDNEISNLIEHKRLLNVDAIADESTVDKFLHGKIKLTLLGELRGRICGIAYKQDKRIKTAQERKGKIMAEAQAKAIVKLASQSLKAVNDTSKNQ